MDYIHKIIRILNDLGIPPHSSFLLALSGGGDSTALLCLMAQVPGVVLYAARASHGLRSSGEEDAERRLCRELCRERNIPYTDLVLPPGRIRRLREEQGRGMEQAARQERYALLEEHRRRLGADYLLLGHSANDQLETVLMRILSGSGPEGLKGIPLRRDAIIRPLLGETREGLRHWLRENGIRWAEDSSNASKEFRRNRLRTELIPLIADIFPGWESALFTLAERSREVQAALEAACLEAVPIVWNKNGEGRWPLKAWQAAPDYLRSMVLWKALNRLAFSNEPDRRIAWHTVKAIRHALDKGEKWLGYGVEIIRSGDEWTIRPVRPETGQARLVLYREYLSGSFKTKLGPWSVEVSRAAALGQWGYPAGAEDWPLILFIQEKKVQLCGCRGKIGLSAPKNDDEGREFVYIDIKDENDGNEGHYAE
ncbi:MAG: tRNA lysidine(34) synthetase TilS [Spirochaeta sp. LUC14_002_19_P3]|nr:MAG: tRNA lysidine(34) synthetase TilS [Spirochaeta sp. LUC14_002_19_P3]